MRVYCILFILVSIFSLSYDKCDNKIYEIKFKTIKIFNISNHIKYGIILLIPLWLVMGLRWNIGTDFANYKYIFDNISDLKIMQNINIEIGYYWLNRIVAFFSDNSQYIFIIVALMMIIFYIYGFAYNGSNMLVQLTCFLGLGYYFYAMNIMRQYLAISIVCFSFHYLENKQLKKFILGILIAALFHQSVLIWIPICLAVEYFDDLFFYVGSFIFSVIIKLWFPYAVKFLMRFIPYAGYLLKKSNFVHARVSWYNIILSTLVLLVCFFRKREMAEINDCSNNRIKYIWVMNLLYVFFNGLGDSIVRLALSFFFLIPTLLADCINSFNPFYKRVIKVLFVFVMFGSMCFLLNYSKNKYNHFVPYISCFGR